MKVELLEAIFVREEKNRFLGKINIEKKEYDCYIPCSSKLKNYFDVNNRPALVAPIENKKSRTNYRLIAVRADDEWVVVDLNLLNHLLKEKYECGGYFVKQEQNIVGGYRTDLVVEKEKSLKIVEVKGIISLQEEVLTPLNCGNRANKQLLAINEILANTKNEVEYAFVILSNHVKKIKINSRYDDYKKNFIECRDNGMKIRAYRIKIQKDELSVFEDSNIVIEI